MKTIVKNPAKKKPATRTATRSSSTRTAGGKYLHRPSVITNSQTLRTTKTAAGIKYNPADSFIKKLVSKFTESGTYNVTLSAADIAKIKKYIQR